MTMMSNLIEPKSDQLNADDLISGPITITITGMRFTPSAEQPISINYEGDHGKPYKPGKSMGRVLVAAWGDVSVDGNGDDYNGRRLTLYRDPNVKFGKDQVGGIRISHMSDIPKKLTMALTTTRGRRVPYTVEPIADAPKKERATGPDPEKILATARAEARKGADAFRAWWNTGDAKAARDALTPHMKDFQKIAADADAASAAKEDDPFGLPPIDDGAMTEATAALLDEIRKSMADGADAESCRSFYEGRISSAIESDPAAERAISALLSGDQ